MQAVQHLLTEGGEICHHLGLGRQVPLLLLQRLQPLLEDGPLLVEDRLPFGQLCLRQQIRLEGIEQARPLLFQSAQACLQAIHFVWRGTWRRLFVGPGILNQVGIL